MPICEPKADFTAISLGGLFGQYQTLVSIVDMPLLSQYTWTAMDNKADGSIRVVTNTPVVVHKQWTLMSRLLMGVIDAGPDILVDHINMDSLDNRRENLRVCNKSQNMANGLSRGGSSKYKGVYWDKNRNKWLSAITVNYRQIHLGRFDLELDAVKAYNKGALKYFGEFARLNAVFDEELL